MEERFYWLGFSAFSGVGPVKFKLLLDNFGSAKDAWDTSAKDLIKIGFGEVLSQKFEKFRKSFSIENYIKLLRCKGLSFTYSGEPKYPKLLKKSINHPFVLYYCGDMIPVENSQLIAVVGTRKITAYGREVTRLLTEELVNAGFTIVSGLALGVDAVAHQTAIDCNGKTIAVLGSGVDLCYPSANRAIYNSIIEKYGIVVSEFPPGEKPSKGSFPSRNRIIAGLSLGVLVTEGAEDSGALITADHALSNGRRVFAVPGPITSSLSKGPYKLISKGAKLVINVKDILEELKLQILNYKFQINSKLQIPKKKTENKDEQKILELLQNEALHFDQIVRLTKIDSAQLGSTLSIMEIKGLIKTSGSIFSIAS